jgi:hypothetical protein
VGTAGVTNSQIFPVLDEARRIVRSAAAGSNVIRYLLLRMHNEVIKAQYNWEHCGRLSGMNLPSGPPFSVAYPRLSAVFAIGRGRYSREFVSLSASIELPRRQPL